MSGEGEMLHHQDNLTAGLACTDVLRLANPSLFYAPGSPGSISENLYEVKKKNTLADLGSL